MRLAIGLAVSLCVLASPASGGRPQGNGVIAFTTYGTTGTEIYAVPVGGGVPRLLVRSQGAQAAPAWSADGARLLFTELLERGSRQALATANAAGAPLRRLLSEPSTREPIFAPAWFPDGREIVFWRATVRGHGAIYTFALGGGKPRRLMAGSQAAPSPDGKRIAFVVSTADGSDIWTSGRDGRERRRLTQARGADSDPDWSPDASKIVFVSNRDGNYEIYVMNADGSGQHRLTRQAANDLTPAWAPDGTRIAFSSDRARRRQFDIYVSRADGSDQRRLTRTPLPEQGPAWQPLPG